MLCTFHLTTGLLSGSLPVSRGGVPEGPFEEFYKIVGIRNSYIGGNPPDRESCGLEKF